jgi:hypothetical protein
MRLRIHHLLILVLLTGCATIKPIPPETINKINRIGVVSILEDNLRLYRRDTCQKLENR